MSIDNGFAGLLGAWPPSGLLAAPQPDPTQTPGLLQAPSAQPTLGGVLGVPFDPASLTGPAFDPLQVIAGGQGPTGPLSPDDLDWPQALQALHARLLGGQPLTLPLGDPGGYGGRRAGLCPPPASAGRPGRAALDPNKARARRTSHLSAACPGFTRVSPPAPPPPRPLRPGRRPATPARLDRSAPTAGSPAPPIEIC